MNFNSIKYSHQPFIVKLMLLSLVTILPIFILLYSIILPQIENKLFEEKYNYIEKSVSAAYKIVEIYHLKSERNEIDSIKAKQECLEVINKLSVSDKEYYFVFTLDTLLLANPMRPDKIGKKVNDIKDADGNSTYSMFISLIKSHKGGFIQYDQLKPGIADPQPKLAYIKYFRPWNWGIGNGIYFDDIKKESHKLIRNIIYFIGIIVFLSIAAAYLIARQLNKRVQKIVNFADDVSNGNTKNRLENSYHDEIGRLSTSLNNMVDQLHSSIKVIQKEKKFAKENNAIKSMLIENLSKNFRVPIIGILGVSSKLLDKSSKEIQDNFLLPVSNTLRNMLNNITQLTELIKIESNNHDIIFTENQVSSFILKSVSLNTYKSNQKKCVLNLAIKESDLIVYIDKYLFTKFIDFLLEQYLNIFQETVIDIVIDFHPEQVRTYAIIKFSAKLNENSDLAENKSYNLLTSFLYNTLDANLEVYEDLSKAYLMFKIIEGDINISSLNNSLTTTIKIPCFKEFEETAIDKKSLLNEIVKSKPQILAYDDNYVTTEIIRTYLMNICDVDIVNSSQSVIDRCSEKIYNAILMEFIPDINSESYSVAKTVKNNDRYKNIPIIGFLPSDADKTTLNDYASIVQYFLPKPIDKFTLIRILTKEIFRL